MLNWILQQRGEYPSLVVHALHAVKLQTDSELAVEYLISF